MSNIREVEEGEQVIGVDERIVYTLTTTNIGSSPTSISVVAKLEETLADITGTIFPTNSPSAAGDIITLSTFTPSLTYLDKYIRVEVKYTVAGNALGNYFRVYVEL